MRWGVRRNYNQPGGADGKENSNNSVARTKLGRKLNSFKRERQWKSALMEMDRMSTKEMSDLARRISLENNLKTLSKSKVATRSDKEDYLRRHNMDDGELAEKVARLRAKESLHSAVHSATKDQRELGRKIAQIGGSLGVRYVVNKRLEGKDLFEVVTNPKGSASRAKEDLIKIVLEKAKVKSDNSKMAMELIKLKNNKT